MEIIEYAKDDNEFMLFDRIEAIKTTITKYGEENFYVSFSGGKDSTVAHYLLDLALPGNRIPRVFINTGIEYLDIVSFVNDMAAKDDRFELIKPQQKIKDTLERVGYPFKSKEHSKKVKEYQRAGKFNKSLERYVNGEGLEQDSMFRCPPKLRYQFTKDNTLKISELCCFELKKKPIYKWEKETGKSIGITGMRADEGGIRVQLGCILTKHNKVHRFNPLIKVSDEWEEWFIKKYGIRLCKLYYEPYNFDRTGCKGCPFNMKLQEDLSTMELYLPNERKQCEQIWEPVYEEYRRIGFRLKPIEQTKLL